MKRHDLPGKIQRNAARRPAGRAPAATHARGGAESPRTPAAAAPADRACGRGDLPHARRARVCHAGARRRPQRLRAALQHLPRRRAVLQAREPERRGQRHPPHGRFRLPAQRHRRGLRRPAGPHRRPPRRDDRPLRQLPHQPRLRLLGDLLARRLRRADAHRALSDLDHTL